MKIKKSEKTIPIEKVHPFMRRTLEKQYPKEKFSAIRVENWEDEGTRWQKIYGMPRH